MAIRKDRKAIVVSRGPAGVLAAVVLAQEGWGVQARMHSLSGRHKLHAYAACCLGLSRHLGQLGCDDHPIPSSVVVWQVFDTDTAAASNGIARHSSHTATDLTSGALRAVGLETDSQCESYHDLTCEHFPDRHENGQSTTCSFSHDV